MPRINKIRLANIQYDKGKKIIKNLVFDAQGMHTLMVLENGGGKSSLLLLFLQAILPGVPLGARDLSETLAQGKTAHIAIEWILDGDLPRYVCSGFCCKPGGNEGYDYFTYLFNYDGNSDFTIETLPFLNEDEMSETKYQEFQDFLKNHEIHPYTKHKKQDYQRELGHYQIFREEWRNIATTNGDEAGVDEYFEKAKTTLSLMEKFIKATEEVLFDEGYKRKELTKAFSEYRKSLLEIPSTQKNLDDFKVVRNGANAVIESSFNLYNDMQNLANQTNYIERMLKSLQVKGKETSTSQKNFDVQKESLLESLEELKWKIKSHELFEENLRLEELQMEETDLLKKQNLEKRSLDERQGHLSNLNGLRLYARISTMESEIRGYQQQLNLMELDDPELRERLAKTLPQFKSAWKERAKLLEALETSSREKSEGLKTNINEAEEEKDKTQNSMNDIHSKLGKVENWLQMYEQEREGLSRTVALGVDEDLVVLWNKYQEDARKTGSSLEKLRNDRNDKKEKKERTENEIKTLEKDHGEVSRQLETLNRELEEYGKKESFVNDFLFSRRKRYSDIHRHKEDILLFLDHENRRLDSDKTKLAMELETLEEISKRIKDQQHYVPNFVLTQIKDRLTRNHIAVVLGSEWLEQQSMTDAKKRRILAKNPLLPYAILIEESQIATVKNVMKTYNGLSPDYPILFMVKSESLLHEASDNSSFLPLFEHFHIFQPETHQVFFSQSAFETYKNDLGQKIQELKRNLQELQEAYSHFSANHSKVIDFFGAYSSETLYGWRNLSAELNEQSLLLSARLKEETERFGTISSEIGQLKEAIEITNKKLTGLIAIEKELGRFINNYHVYAAEKKRMKVDLETQIANLTTKMEALKASIEQLRIEHGTASKLLDARKQDVRLHQRDHEEFRLESVVDLDANVEAEKYEELKAIVHSINEKFNVRKNDRKQLVNFIDSLKTGIEPLRVELNKLRISEDWLKENHRSVEDTEIEEAQQTVDQARGRYQEAENFVKDVNEKKIGLVERIRFIRTKMSQDPYCDYSKEHHNEEVGSYQKQSDEKQKELKEVEHQIDQLDKLKKLLEDTEEYVREYLMVQEDWDSEYTLDPGEWAILSDKLKVNVRAACQQHRLAKDSVEKRKSDTDKSFSEYGRLLEATHNPDLRMFNRNMNQVSKSILYDYEQLKSRFDAISEAIDTLELRCEQKLEECEKDKSILIERCLLRAKSVYESVMEIQKNSKITLYGKEIQTIQITWEKWDVEDGPKKIGDYLDKVIEDILKAQEKGEDEKKIERDVESYLNVRNLLHQLTPLNDCIVKAFKPHKESIVVNRSLEYAPWEEVHKWSGGEKYAVFLITFIILITHIRKHTQGKQNGWKVVIADNPFGKASSTHILEPVFKVAAATRTQLFCVTALTLRSVLEQFPVVYSGQFRTGMTGKEYLKMNLETGFVRATTEVISGNMANASQMSLFES